MAFTSTNADLTTWTNIVTTTADTVIHNPEGDVVYVTTDTTPASIRDGLPLQQGELIVYGAGVTVKALAVDGVVAVHYHEIGA